MNQGVLYLHYTSYKYLTSKSSAYEGGDQYVLTFS